MKRQREYEVYQKQPSAIEDLITCRVINQKDNICVYIILLQQRKKMAKGSKGKDSSASKRSYARISLKRRKMLINMVTKEGFSIARAIKKLSLKLTTARFILQKYKESGTFPMKQFRRNSRMLRDLPESDQNQVHVKTENEVKIQVVKQEEQDGVNVVLEKAQFPFQDPLVWYGCIPYSF